jgi:hypothetical protein
MVSRALRTLLFVIAFSFLVLDHVIIHYRRSAKLPTRKVIPKTRPRPLYSPFLRDADPPSCYRGSCDYKAEQAVACLTVTPCMAFVLHSVHANLEDQPRTNILPTPV